MPFPLLPSSAFPPPFQTNLQWPPLTAMPTRSSPPQAASTKTASPLYPPLLAAAGTAASRPTSTAAGPTGPPCAPFRPYRRRPHRGRRRRGEAHSHRRASSRRGGSRSRRGRGSGLEIPHSCRGASSRRGGSIGGGWMEPAGLQILLQTLPIPVRGREGSAVEEAWSRGRSGSRSPARSTKRFPVNAVSSHD